MLLRKKIIEHIVFITFILNSFFGYSYVNIRLGGVPLNEIFLICGLFCAIPLMFSVIRQHSIIKLILFWSILFIPFALYDFSIYGFFALRDASHLIEVWWIPLAIIAFSDINERKLHKIIKILIVLYGVRLCLQLLLKESIFVIKGLHEEIDIFSRNNMVLVGSACFWGIVAKIHKNYLILIFYALSVVLFQSRTEIFAICFIGIVCLLIMRVSASIVARFSLLLFAAIVSYSILINIGDIGAKTKFGKVLSISEYAELMLSSTGKSNTFDGSADGVILRKEWRDAIFEKASEDSFILLLGQGFGIPLTNWTVSKSGAIIREPHNSFLSVFARTGIVGIIIWSIFHLVFNIRIFLFLRKNLTLTRNNYFVNFLLCSYLAFLGSYIWALSQPYFEIPQYAISAYIAVGLIISLYKQTYSRITKCAL